MKLGLLDRLDLLLGRFSDSDDNTGKRRRSFGTTAFFWLSLPLVALILSTAIAQIILAFSAVPRISQASLVAYTDCLQLKKAVCSPPQINKPLVSKGLDFGKWPYLGAIVMFLTGFFYAIIRRHQDFQRFLQTADLVGAFANRNQPVPSSLLDTFQMVSGHVGVQAPSPLLKTDGGH